MYFFVLFFILSLTGCNLFSEDNLHNKYHIGIATTSMAQSEDAFMGADYFLKKYGDTKDGGIVVHTVFPDNFINEIETVISRITFLANDPLMRSIIVLGVPGTSIAFKKIKEIRPDILLFSVNPQEDPKIIQNIADFLVSIDIKNRGKQIPVTAKSLGAKKFIFLSFPRHIATTFMSQICENMKKSCKEINLEFIYISTPDPLSDSGIVGAQQFILEQTPQWIKKFGKDTAFFCTVNSEIEPLIKQISRYGGIFIEQYYPSPISCYPGAFNIDLKEEAGNWEKILRKIEKSIAKAGCKNKIGTWKYSFNFSAIAGLSEYAKRIINGEAKINSFEDLVLSFKEYSSNANWKGEYYFESDLNKKNHAMLYLDTYIFN